MKKHELNSTQHYIKNTTIQMLIACYYTPTMS